MATTKGLASHAPAPLIWSQSWAKGVMALEWQILRHFGYQPWVGLPNILAREFLVPEMLQDAANPQALADAMWQQLSDAPHRLRLAQRFTDMHHSLLRNSAVESAAAVLKVIGRG